jgi:dTDP-4-dehydrorhamnose 3,5-epimerase-like enzyme
MNVEHGTKFGTMKNNMVYYDPKQLFHKHQMLDPKKKTSILIIKVYAPKLHIQKMINNLELQFSLRSK